MNPPFVQVVLFGDGELEPSKDNAMLLVEESCGLDLPMQLCQKLALLDFEARKDAAQVPCLADVGWMIIMQRGPFLRQLK